MLYIVVVVSAIYLYLYPLHLVFSFPHPQLSHRPGWVLIEFKFRFLQVSHRTYILCWGFKFSTVLFFWCDSLISQVTLLSLQQPSTSRLRNRQCFKGFLNLPLCLPLSLMIKIPSVKFRWVKVNT